MRSARIDRGRGAQPLAGCYGAEPRHIIYILEVAMSKRFGVSKHRSARKFKRNIQHTKMPNMRGAPMRGGIRL